MDDTNWEEENINDGLETIYSKKINDIEISIKKDFEGIWKVKYNKVNSDNDLKTEIFTKMDFLKKGIRGDNNILEYLKNESIKNVINRIYG